MSLRSVKIFLKIILQISFKKTTWVYVLEESVTINCDLSAVATT